jgi:hypothetical protein
MQRRKRSLFWGSSVSLYIVIYFTNCITFLRDHATNLIASVISAHKIPMAPRTPSKNTTLLLLPIMLL